jgi:2-dehydro-3-deoxygluconokinase
VPDIIGLGEPLVELAAEERGPLGSVRRFRRGWGGDTFNCVVAAARLGASSGYMTRVGDDPFGRALLGLCVEEGIDASRIITDPESYTGLYLIALGEDRRHAFTYFRVGSAASRLHPDEIDEEYIGAARILHTSGITQAISDSALAAADRAIEVARRSGIVVSYDANLRPALRPIPLLRENFGTTAPRADVVFLSGEDIAHLYGDIGAEEAATRVLDLGSPLVVVKSGQAGCLVALRDEGLYVCPPWPVELVDPSGGGDAFAGAFLVEWLLRGATLADAGRLANAVGALTVSGLGAVTPIPTRQRLEEFMQRS